MTILHRMNLMPLPVFAEADAGAGASTVAAGAGASTVAAGAGADTVAAGAGADTVQAGAGKSLMGKEPGDKQSATPGDWPADWREKLAGGDTKRLEELKRVTDPLTLGKRFFDAQEKIRSGKPGDEAMPDPATDAAGAKAWREARGIPEKPDDYKLDDKIDKRLSDDDKAVFGTLKAFAHGKNLPVSAVNAFGEWYAETVESQRAAQKDADDKRAEDAEDALRKDLGNEFKPLMTVGRRYAQEVIPGDVDIFDARLPDGRRLGDVPEVVKSLIKLGTAEFGDVSFAGGEAAKATASRKAELKNIMDTDFAKWEASPALRDEYGKILEAEENAAKKKTAA